MEAKRAISRWAAWEVALLRSRHADLQVGQIAALLGRSRSSVQKKIVKLGLSEPNKRWTDGERATLAALYPTTPPQELAQMLGVTMESLHGQAAAMKLRQGPEMRSRARPNWLPVGSERLIFGAMHRKVAPTGGEKAWKRLEVIAWEEAFGPVPAGKLVTRKDPQQPPTPGNLVLMSRGEICLRSNPWMNLPREVAELIQLKAAITRQVNRLAQTAA